MEMRDRRPDFDALGATVVAVGFSPAPALAALADQLDWPWRFLADPERVLYGRLGLERAPLRRIFTPDVLRRFRQAVADGSEVQRPVEDPRQLGADVVVVGGRTAWLRRQTGPDDRPSTTAVLDAAAAVAPPGRDSS